MKRIYPQKRTPMDVYLLPGFKEELDTMAAERGRSLSGLINDLVRREIAEERKKREAL